jgi:hypothetical protein
MDHVVDGWQTASNFWSASRASLDNGGGHTLPPLLRPSLSLEEIKNIIDEGPPITLADLVGARGGFLLQVQRVSSLHR